MLALERTGEQAAQEVALQQDIEQQRRQRRQQRPGHLKVIVGDCSASYVVRIMCALMLYILCLARFFFESPCSETNRAVV
jgi:hypothetical protein